MEEVKTKNLFFEQLEDNINLLCPFHPEVLAERGITFSGRTVFKGEKYKSEMGTGSGKKLLSSF